MRRNHAPIFAALIGCTLLALSSTAEAQRYIPYKGQIERNGHLFTGDVSMSFSVYDAVTGGNLLYATPTPLTVHVTGGNFSVRIGEVPESVFNASALYLAVTVEGVDLGGRQLIQTSPFAIRAQPGVPFKADSLELPNAGHPITIGPSPTVSAQALEVTTDNLVLVGNGTQVTLAPTQGPGGTATLGINSDISLSGNFVSSRMGGFSPVPNRSTNSFSTGSLSGTFSDSGGTIMLHASASGLCGFIGRNLMQLKVDGTVLASMRMNCNSIGVHFAYPSTLVKLDRAVFAPGTIASPITRTVSLEPVNCPPGFCTSPVVTSLSDSNDFGEITLIRVPAY